MPTSSDVGGLADILAKLKLENTCSPDNTCSQENSCTGDLASCQYCGLEGDEYNLAECVRCSRWFCNHGSGSTGSHLIHHLTTSGHKEVRLHPSRSHADDHEDEGSLKCNNCGCTNIFSLGSIALEADESVILLCRSPCLALKSIAEEYNVDEWEPLITNRAMQSWILETTGRKGRHMSVAEMRKLEETWLAESDSTKTDALTSNKDLPTTKNRYESSLEYYQVMNELVEAAAESDRFFNEGNRLENVKIRWEGFSGNPGIHGPTAFFSSSEEARLALGNRVIIRHPLHPSFSVRGTICRQPFSQVSFDGSGKQFCVKLKPSSSQPPASTSGYTVEMEWNRTTYDRMQNALIEFADEQGTPIHPDIRAQLLGHQVQPSKATFSSVSPAPGLPPLNFSQSMAVQSVLGRPLSMIQGPPGTGKTVTSAAIIYHLASLKKGPILVSAPSNIAVDNLALKCAETGLRVVRVTAKSREEMPSQADHLALHKQAREAANRLGGSSSERRKYQGEFEKLLLRNAQVICVTCVGAGDKRLNDIDFRAVLIDEATQAVEPEALIPIITGAAKQLILIGDHRQLGPVVMCKPAARAGLSHSLFERLIASGMLPITLRVQYRMHPSLSHWPSITFYKGELGNGVSVADRSRPKLNFAWPNVKNPMMFITGDGLEEISSSGTSYLNRTEASQCERMVTKLLVAGILPAQIGVITPYTGQSTYIQQHLLLSGTLGRKDWYAEVEVASVDAFQGREKDYIIFSCVRSNENGNIGFLSDPRRLNVALTRAKYGLIVLGNPRVLSHHPLWSNLIDHFRLQGVVVEETAKVIPAPKVLETSTSLEEVIKSAVEMAFQGFRKQLEESIEQLRRVEHLSQKKV